MDTTGFNEVFDPDKAPQPINIIGCGAIGSTSAVMFTRIGMEKFRLWDFDEVEPHNIANQQFFDSHIGKPKVAAVKQMIKLINPQAKVNTYGKWDENDPLDGTVILAVDNIDTRREIVKTLSEQSKLIIDMRMGLYTGQVYTRMGDDPMSIEQLLKTMNFTHEEAQEATPVSACGTHLSVYPNVNSVVSAAVANFQNFVIKKEIKKMITVGYYDWAFNAI